MLGVIRATNAYGGSIDADDGERFYFRWADSFVRPCDVGHGSHVRFIAVTGINGKPFAKNVKNET
jgi:hypothetical protein